MSHSKKKATSNDGNYDVEWFANRMLQTFYYEVSKDDVSYEAHLFYHDELDDTIIPKEHLIRLPNPLLLQTYMYVDSKGSEWLLGIAIDQNDGKLLYEIWMKNGKVIAKEIYTN